MNILATKLIIHTNSSSFPPFYVFTNNSKEETLSQLVVKAKKVGFRRL